MKSGSQKQSNLSDGRKGRSFRLFTALRLSDAAVDECFRLQRRIEAETASLRRVPRENLHVTVKFLGHLPEAALEGVAGALRTLAVRAPFRVRFDAVDVFPAAGPVRVVYAGSAAPSPEFQSLAGASEEVFQAIGIPAESRESVPHVTLFRALDRGAGPGLREVLRRIPPAMFTEYFASLVLFRSKTDSRGALYEALEEIPFTV